VGDGRGDARRRAQVRLALGGRYVVRRVQGTGHSKEVEIGRTRPSFNDSSSDDAAQIARKSGAD